MLCMYVASYCLLVHFLIILTPSSCICNTTKLKYILNAIMNVHTQYVATHMNTNNQHITSYLAMLKHTIMGKAYHKINKLGCYQCRYFRMYMWHYYENVHYSYTTRQSKIQNQNGPLLTLYGIVFISLFVKKDIIKCNSSYILSNNTKLASEFGVLQTQRTWEEELSYLLTSPNMLLQLDYNHDTERILYLTHLVHLYGNSDSYVAGISNISLHMYILSRILYQQQNTYL